GRHKKISVGIERECANADCIRKSTVAALKRVFPGRERNKPLCASRPYFALAIHHESAPCIRRSAGVCIVTALRRGRDRADAGSLRIPRGATPVREDAPYRSPDGL